MRDEMFGGVGRAGLLAAAIVASAAACGDSATEGSATEPSGTGTDTEATTTMGGTTDPAGTTLFTTSDGTTGEPTTVGPACDPGQVMCDDGCVDVGVDLGNCGSCGNACPAQAQCVDGACVLQCDAGSEPCGDVCVDVQSDDNHCGGCGMACANGEECQGGVCVVPCDLEMCGDVCVDTQSDADHCGGCGNACADGEVCSAGTCALDCDPGLSQCGDACVDQQVDPQNCGGCDVACQGDEQCVDGGCAVNCQPNEMACNFFCVDTDNDVENCGDCDNACPGPNNGVPLCQGGACTIQCDDGYLPDPQAQSCTNCNAAAIHLDGPIAYWRLGESAGAMTAADELLNNDGSYLNVTLEAPGISGDGDTAATLGVNNDSRVDVPGFNIMPTTALSIEVWVNSNDTNAGTPFSYAVPGTDNEVLIYNVNNLAFYLGGPSTPTQNIDVADGMWHHIAVTWQSSDGDTNIYVDGAVVYNGVLGQGVMVEQGGHLALGHEQDGVNANYDPTQRLIGDLDEVVIFDYVLTQAQVTAHYNALRGMMCDQ